MTASTALGLVLAAAVLVLLKRRKDRERLPPHRKGWPLVGNALEMPLSSAAPTYASWAKELGSDIISANSLGTTFIILDSYDAAVELLEKRSNRTSSRPASIMATEFLGFDFFITLLPYGELWKYRRRLFVKHFRVGPDGTGPHTERTEEFVHRFLLDVKETPDEFYQLVHHMVGGLAVSLTYGVPIQGRNDPVLEFVNSMNHMITEEMTPGKAIVDILPFMRHLPSWFPGAGFKRYAKSVRWKSQAFRNRPYEQAVSCFGTPDARPSFVSETLASLESSSDSADAGLTHEQRVEAMIDTAAVIFGAAADTTVGAILTYIRALSTHPQVRKRVQAELDALLLDEDRNSSGAQSRGRTLRLPTLEDKDELPYLMATIMESMRWIPVTPFGVPHLTTEDDHVNGYFIPKDSIVIANLMSMLHSENTYGPDTSSYIPDRFLVDPKAAKVEINKAVRDPADIAFGFGRRKCPGSHIAQTNIWLTAACLLTVYDLGCSDENVMGYVGPDGKVSEQFDPGFICHPKPFKCSFRVRSPEAEALLRDLEMSTMPHSDRKDGRKQMQII